MLNTKNIDSIKKLIKSKIENIESNESSKEDEIIISSISSIKNEDEILKLYEELFTKENEFLDRLQIILNNTVEIIKLSDNLVPKEDKIREVNENDIIIEQDIMEPVKDAMKKMGSDLSNKDLISRCYLEVKESISNRTDIKKKYAYCYKVATNYLNDYLIKDIKSQL